jgi:ornithine cyclodeaminase/alanine dehydrogenase-like protein (mu-crystallin family)
MRWPVVKGVRRQDKFQRVYPNHYVGLVLLFSIESGELLAILKEGFLQKMRVGGTSGPGIKYLARPDASVIGLFGLGWQASAQLMAACAVRKINRMKVYSPNANNRKRFAAMMGQKFEIEVETVQREAAQGVDILLAGTNSMQPALFPEWVKEGMHVGSINTRRELAPGLPERCDYVVVNTREPDLQICVGGSKEGIAPLHEKEIECGDAPELGEVIVGKRRGPQSASETTLFLNNIALGTQFAAVGTTIYEAAKAKGLSKVLGKRAILNGGWRRTDVDLNSDHVKSVFTMKDCTEASKNVCSGWDVGRGSGYQRKVRETGHHHRCGQGRPGGSLSPAR